MAGHPGGEGEGGVGLCAADALLREGATVVGATWVRVRVRVRVRITVRVRVRVTVRVRVSVRAS